MPTTNNILDYQLVPLRQYYPECSHIEEVLIPLSQLGDYDTNQDGTYTYSSEAICPMCLEEGLTLHIDYTDPGTPYKERDGNECEGGYFDHEGGWQHCTRTDTQWCERAGEAGYFCPSCAPG